MGMSEGEILFRLEVMERRDRKAARKGVGDVRTG